MKVVSIGTDRKLFNEASPVFLRVKEYASKVKEMHVVVFSLKSHGLQSFRKDNLYVYSTNSSSKWAYVFDAINIGKKIITHEGLASNNSVLTCQDPFETGLVGYFLKNKFHLPLQLQVHVDFLNPYFKTGFLNRLRVLMAKFVVPSADGVRVVSSVIEDSLKKHFPNLKSEISVLPVFVDIQKIINREIGFDSSNLLTNILMVSRFASEKRIEDGLEAFKKIISENIKAKLTIVGSGPEKENILSKINELDLRQNVSLEEWENDVILRFKKSDIYLLTSEYEGYGMTLIEAGASGCAIVTTKVGVAKTDLFKDTYNSYVCDVGDIEKIAFNLKDLIINPDKRKLFKQRMQDNIKSVSISHDEYVSKYIHLLKKLIKNA